MDEIEKAKKSVDDAYNEAVFLRDDLITEGGSQKFFHPALTIDRNNKLVLLGISKYKQRLKDKKILSAETISIITNNGDIWVLNEDELKNKNLFPNAMPSFGNVEPRWSPESIKNFLKIKSDYSDSGDFQIKTSVDPYKDIFLPIKETLEKFIDFSNPTHSTVIALWIMGTYLFPIFEAYPYLGVGGMKGSGKSKILEILQRLTFNAFSTSNATPASLFRIIEKNLCTVLIDEGEALTGRESNQDLRLILNAGYKSSGLVTRTNTETFKVETFRVYSPKAIASINPLDQTLASRCISIVLLRTSNKEIGRTRINDRAADWQGLRNNLYLFTLEHSLRVAEIFDKDEELSDLTNRTNELFLPLFAIASYCDQYTEGFDLKLLKILSSFANESVDEEDNLDDWSLWVLEALDELVTASRPYLVKEIKHQISQQKIIQGEIIDEKMTPNWIGGCLRRFGFKRGKPTRQGKTYQISRQQITDLQVRFGLKPPLDNKVTLVTKVKTSNLSKFERTKELFTKIKTEHPFYNRIKDNLELKLQFLKTLEPFFLELHELGISRDVCIAILAQNTKIDDDLVKRYLPTEGSYANS